MNCLYCQQLTSDEGEGVFICEDCDVIFECSSPSNIYWIFFNLKKYKIGVDVEHKIMQIFNKDSFNCFIVNYLPDVNPNNINQLLDRLLNLRVFL